MAHIPPNSDLELLAKASTNARERHTDKDTANACGVSKNEPDTFFLLAAMRLKADMNTPKCTWQPRVPGRAEAHRLTLIM